MKLFASSFVSASEVSALNAPSSLLKNFIEGRPDEVGKRDLARELEYTGAFILGHSD